MTRSYLGYVSSQTTDTVPVMSYGVATGGSSSSITVGGQAYTMLTFTGDGTLTVTKAGLFDVTVIGGGGGGGNCSTEYSGGGGGAGGWRQATLYLDSNVSIVVGAGAPGANNTGQAVGNPSYIGTLVLAHGGGRGGTYDYFMNGSNNNFAANGGGQNGNGTWGAYAFAGGNAGGSFGARYDYYSPSGGGGGQNAAGSSGSGTGGAYGGAGGAGKDYSLWRGESAGTTYYGGGGGGAGRTGSGAGGIGGGGAGGVGNSSNGTAGTANTGGGGGGATQTTPAASTAGASGGSGIVLVRFKV